MPVSLPVKGRDLRLDIFRGIANWGIFINHIPNNIVGLLSLKNLGFCDFADVFVFVSGYIAAFVYARIMSERGFVAGAAKLLRRAWQIYAAHVFLLVFYVAIVGSGALNYGIPPREGPWGMDYNIGVFRMEPVQTLLAGVSLQYMPVNMDILPLYVLFMVLFPLVLWSMLRKPDLTLLVSAVVYFSARHWGVNLTSFKGAPWYFNPFAWQMLFVIGAWCAMGGAQRLGALIRSRAFLIGGSAYLILGLVMRTAELHPELKALLPSELTSVFITNNKTNLPPYRLLHFMILAGFAARFIPRGWEILQSRWFKPAALCGQKSLEVFALGTMLSFIAHFYLQYVSDSALSQILVSFLGIGILCSFAYMISKWKSIEAGGLQPVLAAQPVEMKATKPAELTKPIYVPVNAK